MSKKLLKSNKGVTLIELLAALAIIGMIGVATYSILLGGINTYNNINEEVKLRDEADYILSNLIHDIFPLKASDINFDESNSYYITKKNGHITGFKDAELLINGMEVQNLNQNVQIDSHSVLNGDVTLGVDDTFEVKLILTSLNSGHKLEINSVLTIINDLEGGVRN